MRIEAHLVRAAAIFVLAPARERDQHRALTPGLSANASGHFVAVELRHADVEQHDVGMVFRRHFQGFGAIGCRVNLVTVALEQRREAIQGVPVVVGKKNPVTFPAPFTVPPVGAARPTGASR